MSRNLSGVFWPEEDVVWGHQTVRAAPALLIRITVTRTNVVVTPPAGATCPPLVELQLKQVRGMMQ